MHAIIKGLMMLGLTFARHSKSNYTELIGLDAEY